MVQVKPECVQIIVIVRHLFSYILYLSISVSISVYLTIYTPSPTHCFIARSYKVQTLVPLTSFLCYSATIYFFLWQQFFLPIYSHSDLSHIWLLHREAMWVRSLPSALTNGHCWNQTQDLSIKVTGYDAFTIETYYPYKPLSFFLSTPTSLQHTSSPDVLAFSYPSGAHTMTCLQYSKYTNKNSTSQVSIPRQYIYLP